MEAALRFTDTGLGGAKLIGLEPAHDERGFFARTFCVKEFENHGLCGSFVQHSLSQTSLRGSVRGMHFQSEPAAEVKIVSCRKGAIYDLIIDLRPASPTFGRWQGFELTAANHLQLYIPKGFAHGFQTLTDDCEVGYLISEFYMPESAYGVRYDDPFFAIQWPLIPTVVSEKDRAWPAFQLSPP